MSTLRLAVVGHTNVGKTSLLRTLLRNTSFGEVSNRPATTRHAEAAQILLGDALVLELIDTPGFEDSSSLLDAIHNLQTDRRDSGKLLVERFLQDATADADFAQEAKALRQMLACDLMLLVVDAREQILGKYVDEFRLAAMLAKPCLVILNFIARESADEVRWRRAAQEASLHNISAFDTVVFDRNDERRLWQQIELLLPAATLHCQRLRALQASQCACQRKLAARMIAGFLLNCAAWRVNTKQCDAQEMIARVRHVEASMHLGLLTTYRFNPEDYLSSDLPLPTTSWAWDPFSAEVLEELGLSLGISAAKGAAVGAMVDAFTAFHSLGAATLIGAAIGAGIDSISRIARAARERWTGTQFLQIEIGVMLLLARRAVRLVQDIEHRGHAAQTVLAAISSSAQPLTAEDELRKLLVKCQHHPQWSNLDLDGKLEAGERERALDQMTRRIEEAIGR